MGADAEHDERLVDDPGVTTALVEELMKKSSLCWLRLTDGDRHHAIWHVWHEGAAYLVSGGSEQPVPGMASAEDATVVVRTKDSRQRMLAWRAQVSTVSPGTPEWDDAVPRLVAARLNLHDMDRAAERWAQECLVTRLTPTGQVAEGSDTPPDGDLAAPPLPTSATTRRALPMVLHRRQTRRPDLS